VIDQATRTSPSSPTTRSNDRFAADDRNWTCPGRWGTQRPLTASSEEAAAHAGPWPVGVRSTATPLEVRLTTGRVAYLRDRSRRAANAGGHAGRLAVRAHLDVTTNRLARAATPVGENAIVAS